MVPLFYSDEMDEERAPISDSRPWQKNMYVEYATGEHMTRNQSRQDVSSCVMRSILLKKQPPAKGLSASQKEDAG